MPFVENIVILIFYFGVALSCCLGCAVWSCKKWLMKSFKCVSGITSLIGVRLICINLFFYVIYMWNVEKSTGIFSFSTPETALLQNLLQETAKNRKEEKKGGGEARLSPNIPMGLKNRMPRYSWDSGIAAGVLCLEFCNSCSNCAFSWGISSQTHHRNWDFKEMGVQRWRWPLLRFYF